MLLTCTEELFIFFITAIIGFDTEEQMIETYFKDRFNHLDEIIMAVVFENKNIDNSTVDLEYKIQMPKALPRLYTGLIPIETNVFQEGFTGLQLCIDKSFITSKGKGFDFDVRKLQHFYVK